MNRAARIAVALHRRQRVTPPDYEAIIRRAREDALYLTANKSEIAYRMAEATQRAKEKYMRRLTKVGQEKERQRWIDFWNARWSNTTFVPVTYEVLHA